MIGKMMMTAAFAVATLGVPVTAQTTGSGSMGSGSTQSGSMGSGSIGSGSMGSDSTTTGGQTGGQSGSMGSDSSSGGMQSGGGMKTDGMNSSSTRMTRAETASMRRCQAMTPARMMKNKTCTRLQAAHPEMGSPSGM